MRSNKRRILVIHDDSAIQDDFRKILEADFGHTSALPAAEDNLSGSTPQSEHPCGFVVDSAHQGHEGLALIHKSLEEKFPYAMAFIVVGMPPGWDGVETLARIWEIYPDLQVVM